MLIFIGYAIEGYSVHFTEIHPMYWYKNGKVQQYVDSANTVNYISTGGSNMIPSLPVFWSQGTYNSNGVLTNSSNEIRLNGVWRKMDAGQEYTITKHGVRECKVLFFNSGVVRFDDTGWISTYPHTFTAPTGTVYFTAVYRKATNTVTSLSDLSTIKFKLEKGSNPLTDWNVSWEEKANVGSNYQKTLFSGDYSSATAVSINNTDYVGCNFLSITFGASLWQGDYYLGDKTIFIPITSYATGFVVPLEICDSYIDASNYRNANIASGGKLTFNLSGTSRSFVITSAYASLINATLPHPGSGTETLLEDYMQISTETTVINFHVKSIIGYKLY